MLAHISVLLLKALGTGEKVPELAAVFRCHDRIMHPQMCLQPNLGLVSVRLHGKEKLRLEMELRLLISLPWNEEITMDYSGGPNIITKVLTGERRW